MLPSVFYILNTISVKSSAAFFVEIDMLILKFIQNCKGPRIAKTILKKKNKVGGLTYPDFKAKRKQQKSRQCGAGTSTDI